MLSHEFLKYVRELTSRDKKTLSQKVVKTMEEVGELSREVLPLENATGTLHRFTTPSGALEEIVDSMLCLLSIGYELGATDDEIEKMLWKKAEYWNQLQLRETGAKFPVPYEIHITVDDAVVTQFKEACDVAGVKMVYLDLLDADGVVIKKELMTASKIIGNNSSSYSELTRVKDILQSKGFKPSREKIETVPWHPAASRSNMAEGDAYFECHFNLIVPSPDKKEEFLSLCKELGIVLSMNNSKNLCGTRYLATIRHKNKGWVEHIVDKSKLILHLYNPHDFMMEYALYDTDVSHDASWINS